MNLFNIGQARRRILNAIDAVQRLDNARPHPDFHKSRMGERVAERQREQREQVRHTLDVLIAAHEERDALRKELDETKAALQRLVYGTPSCVLAGVVRNGEVPTPPIQYTGHGKNTGGLQQHSIGPEYPFITYKRGDFWRVLDARTGNTHSFSTSDGREAHKAAAQWAQQVREGFSAVIGKNGQFTYHKENA